MPASIEPIGKHHVQPTPVMMTWMVRTEDVSSGLTRFNSGLGRRKVSLLSRILAEARTRSLASVSNSRLYQSALTVAIPPVTVVHSRDESRWSPEAKPWAPESAGMQGRARRAVSGTRCKQDAGRNSPHQHCIFLRLSSALLSSFPKRPSVFALGEWRRTRLFL